MVVHASLVVIIASSAIDHAESLVLVGAASNTGVVGCKAGLPVHGIIGDASLVVSGTSRARS